MRLTEKKDSGHWSLKGVSWFIGDETESLVSQDMFVSAWMPLPEPYRAEVEEN